MRSSAPVTSAPRTGASWCFPQRSVLEYAGASADLNDIHWSAEAAVRAGFERPIVHGMFLLGRLLVEVERRVGIGQIASAAARFASPALVGACLAPDVATRPDGELAIGVRDGAGTVVLSGHARTGHAVGDTLVEAPDGELVADRRLVVESGPATRLAAVLGADHPAYFDAATAVAAGLRGCPTVPTLGFVLPAVGFRRDLPGNAGQAVPDVVAECQRWCGTDLPVVHATQGFTFSRPLAVGEVVRAQTHVVDRRSRPSRGRRLHFTDVRTVLTDDTERHVLTSDMGLVVIEAADPKEIP